MNQIRFDFLGSAAGSGRSSNANANTAESGDAFAQILDQQLTRRADAGASRRAVEARGRSEASDRAEAPRPHILKRRDKAASEAPAVKAEPKAKPEPKATTERPASETCAKPSAKPESEKDETAGAAACGQTATESTSSGSTTETESQPDNSGDTEQQPQGEESQQQASDGAEQPEAATAEVNLDLLAMLAVPLPLQTIAVEGEVSAETAVLADGGDAAAAALQAQLAASLAESIDLTAAVNGKAQVQPTSGGLKFGAILNAGTGDKQPIDTDTLAALQAAAEEIAKTAETLPAPGTKPRDAAATPSKARDAATENSAATVNPEQNGKSAAAIVQPMNRAAAVTWSGTGVRNELAESMAVQAGASFAADDAEFSNWSQALGSGAAGLSNHLSARQAAFMNQLRQGMQNLPAHEQIAVQIKSAMQNGNSRLTVSLHPVELGRVEVKLDIDKDKNVTATIVVERPGTLELLRNDAKALERALQDAGLQTDSGSLSFSLKDSNGQNGGSQNGTGTGGGSGSGNGGSESEVKAEVRADVVATADGYVDLET